jgi:hypothetical protein
MRAIAIYQQLTPASHLTFAARGGPARPSLRGKQSPTKQVTSDRHRRPTLLRPIE